MTLHRARFGGITILVLAATVGVAACSPGIAGSDQGVGGDSPQAGTNTSHVEVYPSGPGNGAGPSEFSSVDPAELILPEQIIGPRVRVSGPGYQPNVSDMQLFEYQGQQDIIFSGNITIQNTEQQFTDEMMTSNADGQVDGAWCTETPSDFSCAFVLRKAIFTVGFDRETDGNIPPHSVQETAAAARQILTDAIAGKNGMPPIEVPTKVAAADVELPNRAGSYGFLDTLGEPFGDDAVQTRSYGASNVIFWDVGVVGGTTIDALALQSAEQVDGITCGTGPYGYDGALCAFALKDGVVVVATAQTSSGQMDLDEMRKVAGQLATTIATG